MIDSQNLLIEKRRLKMASNKNFGFYEVNRMMPKNYHPGDARWIAEQLDELGVTARARACQGYSSVYASTELQHPGIGAEGRARRAANIRLREFIERYKCLHGGEVYLPPQAAAE